MSKLQRISDYLGSHAKAYVSAAGSAATLAISLFPSDPHVQEIGGAIGIVATFLLVHLVPNAPVTTELATAIQDGPGLFDQLHLQLPDRWVEAMEKLVEILQTAKPPAPAPAIEVDQASLPVPDPAPEPPSAATEPAPPDSVPPGEDDFADVPPL